MSVSPEALYGFLGLCVASAVAAVARARLPEKRRDPIEGQAGKDVVWVPTPSVYLEKMLDLARLTSRDYLIDLGSGDGRIVIAAAKRGARALGVEYNPDLIELSRRTAAVEGVAERATFMQGDLYEADISGATVLVLFLMPDMLSKLSAKFLELPPGTRIVTHRFAIDGWEENEIKRVDGDSPRYCTALLYVVPDSPSTAGVSQRDSTGR